MTKKTFKNNEFKNYKIMVKLINDYWHIYCKNITDENWTLCDIDNYNDTWYCIIDPINHNDTYMMFNYIFDIYCKGGFHATKY